MNSTEKNMRLPIGYSDFGKILEKNLDFVDKSLLIKEIIEDNAEVLLITRPRRFGKTLNLSMLQHFFAAEVRGQATKPLFSHLKIGADENSMQHQGKYPVIFLTLKDVKDRNYHAAYENLCEVVRRLYGEHRILLESTQLYKDEKLIYQKILEKQASDSDIEESLRNLTEYLARHYGVKPWILIDEYDTPIQSGYLQGYYDEIIGFMRNFFGAALKDNPYLEKAVMTGILRISKESLFSGLNNIEVYSLLRTECSHYFGFTESETEELLRQSNLQNRLGEIKNWYNGYQVGETVVYNPWSIINCIKQKGELQPYWINTSDNALIKDLLIQSSESFKNQFQELLQGRAIERLVDENFVFGDLTKNEDAIWSLLLMAGYLKVTAQQRTSDGLLCTLAIPNQEVRNLYQQIVKQWLSSNYGIEWYNQFLNYLLTGNIIAFERCFQELMDRTISYHDTATEPEAFYHGLLVGITASLHNDANYELQSNRESGRGRYDYMIFSKDNRKPTLILEFKKIAGIDQPEKLMAKLEQGAKDALAQINQKSYVADAKRRGSSNILKLGLAFCGKHFKISYEQ